MTDSRFLPALALSERRPLCTDEAGPVRGASDRARWRLSRWRGAHAFPTAEAWRRRLAADACDEPTLLRLLDEAPAAIAERLPASPGWASRLHDLYSRAAVDGWLPESLPGRPLDDALTIVAPLLADARRAVASAATATGVDPGTVAALGLAELLDELVKLLSRACVLELNIARVRGELSGRTPAERFAGFFSRMADPAAALSFLSEYPVLARQLLTVIDAWASSTVELLHRLHADRDLLRALGVGPRAGLAAIRPAGDSHRGGRKVCLVSFDDGTRVVYKPHDVAIDARFQLLLGWLGDLGGPSPRTLAVLPRDGYGWTEFVPTAEPESAGVYARRYGGLLALLYTLGATDCHAENVLASGDHPVLVDVETLFTPAVARGDGTAVASRGTVIAQSVVAVGLLPAVEAGVANGAPCNCAEWLGAGTDEMALHVPGIHIGHDVPAVADRRNELRAHLDEVLAGFRETYDLLRRNAGGLAERVRAFAGDEIRVVLRPTRTYTRLQEAALHTDYLRDGLDRDRLLDWLWAGVDELPMLAATIADERRDLAAGDIPLFTSRVDSLDLWTARGERLPDLLRRSALAEALARIDQLGDADRDRQLWLVRASFAALAELPGAPHALVRWRAPLERSRQTLEPQRLLDRAAELGERIAAMRHGEADWFTFGPAQGARWAPVPMGAGLYDGLPGLALFYAYLGRVGGRGEFTALARRIAGTLGDRLRAGQFDSTSVGAFNGWGGLCYTYGHLTALWDGDAATRSTLDLTLDRLESLAETANAVDVVDGLAGAVLAVLSCGADPGRTVPLARRLGDRLIALGPESTGLGGFSHGTAGTAAALLTLAARTGGGQRYAEAGSAALAADRALFDAAVGNWADLREPGLLSNAWCHGAPGIGLSRLLVASAAGVTAGPADVTAGVTTGVTTGVIGTVEVQEEIAVAERTTLAHGFGRNHSLCHGDLGNLELLVHTRHPSAGTVMEAILADVDEHGWRCANPAGLESPELMTGLSGMGYQLMRVARPETVPSLLILEGPR